MAHSSTPGTGAQFLSLLGGLIAQSAATEQGKWRFQSITLHLRCFAIAANANLRASPVRDRQIHLSRTAIHQSITDLYYLQLRMRTGGGNWWRVGHVSARCSVIGVVNRTIEPVIRRRYACLHWRVKFNIDWICGVCGITWQITERVSL